MTNELKHLGRWLAAGSKDELLEKGHKEEYDSWTDKLQGDRLTQLVIIGSGLDKDGITKSLDDCLISEAEYEKLKTGDGINSAEWVADADKEDDEDPFKPYDKEEEEEEWEDCDEKEAAVAN